MLSDQQIQELEATHKRVAVVTGRGGTWQCAFRKPTRAEYKRFRTMATGDSKADAQEMLARATVVFPSLEAFDALLEDYPAIPEAAAGRIADLTGFAVEESGK